MKANLSHAPTALVAALLAAALGYVPISQAQSVDAVINSGDRTIKLAQESQGRIDEVVEDTRSLADQYNRVTKEVDGLEVYNTLLQRQVDNQEAEMATLGDSIDRVTVIERQIMPLMLRMIDGLEQFVDLDVPFLEEEREKRVGFLRTLMERSDVSVAEKFRRVLEAFQIENDFGRTIEAYKGTLDLAGGVQQVDFLRIGRVALLYQSVGGENSGRWDQQSRQFVELPSTYRNQIRQGLRMARKQVAPDLLLLPIAAPEEAR